MATRVARRSTVAGGQPEVQKVPPLGGICADLDII